MRIASGCSLGRTRSTTITSEPLGIASLPRGNVAKRCSHGERFADVRRGSPVGQTAPDQGGRTSANFGERFPLPYKQGVSSSSLLAPTGIGPNGTAIAGFPACCCPSLLSVSTL
jgi:hypothetical protein